VEVALKTCRNSTKSTPKDLTVPGMRKLTTRAEKRTTQPHPPSGGIVFVLLVFFLADVLFSTAVRVPCDSRLQTFKRGRHYPRVDYNRHFLPSAAAKVRERLLSLLKDRSASSVVLDAITLFRNSDKEIDIR